MKPLYIAKMKACYKLADFSDIKKDTEWKDKKKDALIDLIDILDDSNSASVGPQLLFNEQIFREVIKFVESNIFRTFTNKQNKKTSSVDPDEDEPHLEEAWPHL